nr:hypothetical protein [Tanacetum cinerariifolium]
VKRLGLPPSPELVTFGLSAKEKEMKRTEIIKEGDVLKDEFVIKAMSDCIKAREIVEKNLDN